MYETGALVKAHELIANLASDVPAGVTKESLLAHFEGLCNPDKRTSSGIKVYSFGVLDRREFLEREASSALISS
jgi:hypothetical protein